MAGATTVTADAIMKEVYQPAINQQVFEDNPLLDEIDSTSDGVQVGPNGGRFTVIALKLGRNASPTSYAEGGLYPDAGHVRFGKATIDLTSFAGTASVTGMSMAKTKSEVQAYVSILAAELDGIKEGLKHDLGRQVWNPSHGGFCAIGTVTGTGPWTFPVPARIIENDWVEETTLLNTGTESGGVFTARAGVLQVTAVDQEAYTITVATYSGSPAPTTGDLLVINGSANLRLTGLPQIVNSGDTFQELNGATERRWNAVVNANGGTPRAYSTDLVNQLRNKIYKRSGRKPDLVLTTLGVERAAFNELKDQIRYTKPDDLNHGKGVVLPGAENTRLRGDSQAPTGQLWAINKDSLRVYSPGGFEFEEQGGSNLLLTQLKDEREIVMKRYMQVGCTFRAANGRLDDLTDSASNPF